MAEINDMKNELSQLVQSNKLMLLPLHSDITSEEQGRVFDQPPVQRRKVILSTNIAESSITVPDIKYVIDFCLTRNLVCDPESNFTSLQKEWAAKTSCTQRKGRAGRVSNGRVYRMVTREFYEEHIADYGIPEMKRCPLDQLVLRTKLFNLMGEPKALLGLALSPPYLDDIERTILSLKQIGALTALDDGVVNPHDGNLTFLGSAIARLPLDVKIGKLILLGHVFGLLEECVIIAAALTLKSFFSRPLESNLEAYSWKLSWSRNSLSDLMAILKAYRVWETKKNLGEFRRPRQETDWGRRSFIQIKRIREVEALVKELMMRLAKLNIKVADRPVRHSNAQEYLDENQLLLKMIFCGAFYPNYFDKTPMNEEDANRAMSGWNPYNTVLVKGLPPKHSLLYAPKIQALFKACCTETGVEPRVHVEGTKAFVQFTRSEKQQSNQFSLAVYMALKMSQLRIPLQLEKLDEAEADDQMRVMDNLNVTQSREQRRLRTNRFASVSSETQSVSPGKQVDLPSASVRLFEIHPTEVLNAGHFWACYGNKSTWQQKLQLHQYINSNLSEWKTVQADELLVGNVVLAPFTDGEKEYYRARITGKTGVQVTVFFLDYGNTDVCHVRDLRCIEENMLEQPFQAFECELAEIKPSAIRSSEGKWTEEALKEVMRLTNGVKLYAKVYSIVQNIVRVNLYTETQVHINELLVSKNYADYAPESYLSQQNHIKREEEERDPTGGYTGPEYNEGMSIDVAAALSANKPNRRSTDLLSGLRDRTKHRYIKLNGPESAYEMRFTALSSFGEYMRTRIDNESVNSVALNDESQNRLMVAANVRLNPSGSYIQAGNSTIMPSIPGLTALMAMLFCPTIELRTDPQSTRFIGCLCGLGMDLTTGGAAMPDQDMEITFDTVIDTEDIEMINIVRHTINVAIGSDGDIAEWDAYDMQGLQRIARNRLLDLVRKRRVSMEPQYFVRSHTWNLIDPRHLNKPRLKSTTGASSDLTCSQLYQLHCVPTLHTADQVANAAQKAKDNKQRILSHLDYLQKLASNSTRPEDISCKLCNDTLRTPRELKLHLATRKHKEKAMPYLL